MTDPVEVDIPHKLGREAAKTKIAAGIGKLESYIPGGSVTDNRWEGDRLSFTVSALGQKAHATVDVLEDKAHLAVMLPPMLSLFAGKVREMLGREGPKLLK
ncbi:polyhydroxyalkanoic acid system family protein [Sphingomonas donggukensis]|uniref:Polyhydroxyalkanoic acid system family protein n=1 Tax=Sphingomonas donggukensis TaxID=2949093 RepID=A0ABY4TUF0_9SPHN|nr:polyhydroxyalkanoic acid system family protein [Sphingomonas donggukensis]URW75331.1 polyhydroxyalkanoic acid system family protein [Sphingomonas donggukensis]